MSNGLVDWKFSETAIGWNIFILVEKLNVIRKTQLMNKLAHMSQTL